MIIIGVRSPLAWYLVGALHAAVVGGFMWMVNIVFIANDREAIWHLRGSWGEKNTSDVLGTAKRKKLIWGWVDSITLERGDLDHLVVTRSGGVLVIDSKWRTDITDRAAIIDKALRAQLRSDGVVRTLLRAEQGSHRARLRSVSVRPLVVIWGAAQSELPDVVRSGGVEVVSGQGLLAWLQGLSGDPVDKDAAAHLLRQLEIYRDRVAAAIR